MSFITVAYCLRDENWYAHDVTDLKFICIFNEFDPLPQDVENRAMWYLVYKKGIPESKVRILYYDHNGNRHYFWND